MNSTSSLSRCLRAPLWLVITVILLSFVVPAVLAQPGDGPGKLDSPSNPELVYDFDSYFALVNYNEPSNPYVVVNYYYENGSQIRMVFGMDKDLLPSLNLNYQNNVVQVFDKKGRLDGYGAGFKHKSRVFIYVDV